MHRIEAERYIKTQTNFEMNIVIKPMIVDADTITRMNTTYIKPKILHTCDPMVIFDSSAVNAELVSEVKQRGYRVGVWTCLPKYTLPLAEWGAFGFEPEVLFGPRECIPATDAHKKQHALEPDTCMKDVRKWVHVDSTQQHRVVFVDNTTVKYEQRYHANVVMSGKISDIDAKLSKEAFHQAVIDICMDWMRCERRTHMALSTM